MFRRWLLNALALGIAGSACQWIAGIGSSAIEGTDAGVAPAPEAGPETRVDGGSCGDAHDFCDDFDGEGLETTWTRIERNAPNDAGVVELDESLSMSKPRSLKTQLPASSASQQFTAAVVRGFTRRWSPLTLEFDVYVGRPGAGAFNNVAITSIYFGSSSNANVELDLFLAPDYLQITYGDGNQFVRTAKPFPTDRWVHMQIRVSPSSSAGFFELTTDVPDAPTPYLRADLPPEPAPGLNEHVELHMGLLRFNTPTPDLVVHYDNVKLDFSR